MAGSSEKDKFSDSIRDEESCPIIRDSSCLTRLDPFHGISWFFGVTVTLYSLHLQERSDNSRCTEFRCICDALQSTFARTL